MSNTVIVETSLGAFHIALDSARAPKSVANFLRYVDAGHYSGTIFHRVIPGFMAQGGGYDTDYGRNPTNPPVDNEADNGLRNTRATVAMARTSDPHSATAQFFVNLVDNSSLDHQAKAGPGWGYAVFGKVTSGMEIVDAMSERPTGAAGSFVKNAPITQIVIHSIHRA